MQAIQTAGAYGAGRLSFSQNYLNVQDTRDTRRRRKIMRAGLVPSERYFTELQRSRWGITGRSD